MFIGDSSSTTENEIMDKYNLLDIDVLKIWCYVQEQVVVNI